MKRKDLDDKYRIEKSELDKNYDAAQLELFRSSFDIELAVKGLSIEKSLPQWTRSVLYKPLKNSTSFMASATKHPHLSLYEQGIKLPELVSEARHSPGELPPLYPQQQQQQQPKTPARCPLLEVRPPPMAPSATAKRVIYQQQPQPPPLPTFEPCTTPSGSPPSFDKPSKRKAPSFASLFKRSKQCHIAGSSDGTSSQVMTTITFAEVYRDGTAEYRQMIIEFPAGGPFYILRCDEHGVRFGEDALQEAAKHLAST